MHACASGPACIAGSVCKLPFPSPLARGCCRAVVHIEKLLLQVPWTPLLTEEAVQRGTTYYGSGTRLRRVAMKLLAGQPIKVYTLGGSVTVGGVLPIPEQRYASRLFQFINSSYPHRCGGGGQAASTPASLRAPSLPPVAQI